MKHYRAKQHTSAIKQTMMKFGSVQAAGSKKPSGNKTEAAQQVLAVYQAILGHLRAHGALVNSVKPEYLLDEADFGRVMEARTAAAAGNPEQEQALELWAPVELAFGSYSTQAWNCVLLQVRDTTAKCPITAMHVAMHMHTGRHIGQISGSAGGTGIRVLSGGPAETIQH